MPNAGFPLSRRHFLQSSSAALLAGVGLSSLPGSTSAADYTKPVPEAANLTPYLNKGRMLFRWNDLALGAYRTGAHEKYPYFYPLNGLQSNLPLTTESAQPYPHHRGLWLGCDPLSGGNYWSDGPIEQGQIQSTNIELMGTPTETSFSFKNSCQWVGPNNSKPFSDEREFTITILDDKSWAIDAKLIVSAEEEIEIKRAKHSFFALRCAPDIAPMYGGTLMNSEGGTGAEGTYGKPAHWCGYHGQRKGNPDIVEGIAIMNHPENFDGDCPWFTREYGHLSPSPFEFLKKPYKMGVGEKLLLRYRVVMHTGTPQEAGLDQIYQDWLLTA
ncbi:MAG: PmoA family protein [Planctomycetaceae bacterium]|nr:PmoA family protein [Planctomycetaceae bacterium]